MNNFLFQVLFGCSHSKTTFPLTPVRRARAASAETKGQTYITCLNCGKELPYDWQQMRRLRTPRLARPAAALHQAKAAFRLGSAS